MSARRKRDVLTEEDLHLMDELCAGRGIPHAAAWVKRFARRLKNTLPPLEDDTPGATPAAGRTV